MVLSVALAAWVGEQATMELWVTNIRRLARLAGEGPVRLLLTTVTRGEVMDLKEKAREAFNKLKEVRRDARVMQKRLLGHAMDAIEAVKRDDAIARLCKESEQTATRSVRTGY
jgi:hypothetical protein